MLPQREPLLRKPCYDEAPALQAVKKITLKGSIGSLRLSLYDEKNRKLVDFSRVTKVKP